MREAGESPAKGKCKAESKAAGREAVGVGEDELDDEDMEMVFACLLLNELKPLLLEKHRANEVERQSLADQLEAEAGDEDATTTAPDSDTTEMSS